MTLAANLEVTLMAARTRTQDPSVDYGALEAACAEARERFPDAISIRPNYYEQRAMAEVTLETGRTGLYVPESSR